LGILEPLPISGDARNLKYGVWMEYAIQLLLDNIYSTADAGKLTLLVSLDLSAAFDTIDQVVLLNRLNCSFGITVLATVLLHRQNSVCEDRYQFISSYQIYSWCSPRLCPWATTFFYLHLNYFHYCSVSSCLSTAVRRRHASFPRLVTSQLHPKYQCTSVLPKLSSYLVF